MKKYLVIGTIAMVGALALAGCSIIKPPAVYEPLGELSQKEYATVELSSTTVVGGVTLTGEYTSTRADDGYHITYSYEQIATFGEKDGEIVIPDSYKVTYSGTAVVSNGSIVTKSGDDVDLPLGQLTASGLDFSSKNFSDVKQGEGSFSASVADVGAFFGKSVSGSGMTVEVHYTETAFTTLTVRYTSTGNASVTLEYRFR